MVGDISYAWVLLEEATNEANLPAGASLSTSTNSSQRYEANDLSSSPIAPPPFDRRRPPYGCIPLPPQIPGVNRVAIHPVLRYPLDLSIRHDLSQEPPTPTRVVEERIYQEPATDPSLPSLTLVVDGLELMMTVHASMMVNSVAAVTVEDVLRTIYEDLQRATMDERPSSLPFQQQIRGSGGAADPIRRLDILEGRLTASGFSAPLATLTTSVNSSKQPQFSKMMNADIEALVLSGELFNPSGSRSSSPRRSPSPDAGWHDELLQDEEADTQAPEKELNTASDPAKESIGMGPGRTGVKGVIKDRDEANEIQRHQSQQTAREKSAQWERGNLGGRTYLEEEREKALQNEVYGLEKKVDQLVLDEKATAKIMASEFDMFGGAKRGRFGHLREVGVKGFVNAVEREDRGVWVVVHLYDPSLDRCYSLDSTLSQLARAHPETKFIRARASKLGFTSSSSSTRTPAQSSSTSRIRTSSRTLSTIDSDDDEDPYADDDATNSRISDNKIRHEAYEDEKEEEDEEEDDVDLDMLPTMLVYRDGELVHNWVRVDWVAKEPGNGGDGDAAGKGVETLLDRHNILSHYGFRSNTDSGEPSGDLVFSNNLGLPSDDDDDDDELLWSD